MAAGPRSAGPRQFSELMRAPSLVGTEPAQTGETGRERCGELLEASILTCLCLLYNLQGELRHGSCECRLRRSHSTKMRTKDESSRPSPCAYHLNSGLSVRRQMQSVRLSHWVVPDACVASCLREELRIQFLQVARLPLPTLPQAAGGP